MSKAGGETRERRAWTVREDQLLLEAVNKEDPGNPCPSKWSAIATHIPNRTNKDCRKRWFAHFTTDIMKGAWTSEEDQRLMEAMEKHGPKWAKISAVVKTRNSDQCAKRWKDTLDPNIDRTNWSAEADETLLRAVEEHGRLWTKIVNMYFPGKTGLAAKNRYNSLISLSKKSRNPAYNGQPLHANAAPDPSMSSSNTPAIPISNLLSDTSYFGRPRYTESSSSSPTPSSSSSSTSMRLPMQTRMSYPSLLPQQQCQPHSRHDTSHSQCTLLDDTALYSGHAQLDPYLSNCQPSNLAPPQRQISLDYFNTTAVAPGSPEAVNHVDGLNNFSIQACMNIPILPPNTMNNSHSQSPLLNHPVLKMPTSSSSLSTNFLDSFNSGDSFRSSINQPSLMPDTISSRSLEPHLKVEEDDSFPSHPLEMPTDQVRIKLSSGDPFTRDDILLHIETLEGVHQELSDQEQRLKSQRSSLNRVANVYRRRGDDEGARQYEQESIKMVFKLNFVFEQQEGVDAQITSLRRKLEIGTRES
ncbi:hypothetical protein D9758_012353 [Tetrapyrgos nigripes]|uniref:Uncharacterized protein n=1 Tax=Tetrapyrgos nigripes TaxID=182062 RepID=A0A8H5CLZ5_9AGAR|nr:hypothetical protein D9758_012353 [Tetrapyrgos nigripes]